MKDYLIQRFNYLENKHFKNYKNDSPFGDESNLLIDSLINRIDTIINNSIKSKNYNYKTELLEINKQLLQVVSIATVDDFELRDTIEDILKNAFRLAIQYIENRNQNYKNKLNNSDLKSQEKLEELKSNGFSEFSMINDNSFSDFSDKLLNEARLKYENIEDWRGANSLNQENYFFNLISAFITENKIIELISDYKEMDMEFIYAAWDYSHNRQRWFKNNHVIGEMSPTNYYHFDGDDDVAKMMIYLTDVKSGNGVFKYVKGSNLQDRSIFLNCVYTSIDSLISPRFSKLDNLYGRGLMLYRKDLFMKFPNSFIGSTHFGDDLISPSDLAEYLISNTVEFRRLKGSVIIFDGYLGVHAGGNPISGERLAIQVAFRKKRVIKPLGKIVNFIKSKLNN